jgi:hypothetical protein
MFVKDEPGQGPCMLGTLAQITLFKGKGSRTYFQPHHAQRLNTLVIYHVGTPFD